MICGDGSRTNTGLLVVWTQVVTCYVVAVDSSRKRWKSLKDAIAHFTGAAR